MTIHPTAIVDPTAELDPSVEVGAYAIIEGSVRIGPGCRLHSQSQVLSHTTMGSNNELFAGAIIGGTPQHLAYKGSESSLVIGNNNVFREHVTVHRAYHPGHQTTIGNNCFFMVGSHIAHDCTLGNSIIMANGALLAGHVHVDDFANISGNTGVHQYVRIGRLAMIGALARVSKDVPPFMLLEGNSTVQALNTVGLRRAGLDLTTRQQVKQAYRILYRSGLNVPQAIERLEAEFPAVAPVQELVAFIRKSVRGICRHDVHHSSTLSEPALD